MATCSLRFMPPESAAAGQRRLSASPTALIISSMAVRPSEDHPLPAKNDVPS